MNTGCLNPGKRKDEVQTGITTTPPPHTHTHTVDLAYIVSVCRRLLEKHRRNVLPAGHEARRVHRHPAGRRRRPDLLAQHGQLALTTAAARHTGDAVVVVAAVVVVVDLRGCYCSTTRQDMGRCLLRHSGDTASVLKQMFPPDV